jgi:hypothetical protein
LLSFLRHQLLLLPADAPPYYRQKHKRAGPMDPRNPLYATYAVAAALMILKAVGMSWLTVYRMMTAGAGFRSPEDLRKTRLNPNPDPGQLAPNEYVDRVEGFN